MCPHSPQDGRELPDLSHCGRGDPGTDPVVRSRDVKSSRCSCSLAVLGREAVHKVAQTLEWHLLVEEEDGDQVSEVVGPV